MQTAASITLLQLWAVFLEKSFFFLKFEVRKSTSKCYNVSLTSDPCNTVIEKALSLEMSKRSIIELSLIHI